MKQPHQCLKPLFYGEDGEQHNFQVLKLEVKTAKGI
jgi:hypothetical protein